MKEQKIITDIKEHILKNEIGKYILKIILFGSWAKGEAKKDSDIDLLIVKKNGKYEEMINSALYNIGIELKVPIEPLVCSVEDIFWIDNYFLFNILHYGQEVYSVNKNSLKEEAIKGLLDLSKEYFESAKGAASSGNWRLATDAAYNAAELIAKALLLKEIDDLPGSHGGIVNKFGELYVKTNKASETSGRAFHKALQLRNWAIYKWESRIGPEEFNEVSALVLSLREAVEKIIQ